MARSLAEKGGISIEVKINKEIKNYTESVFFGLTLRQCIFSILALGVAGGVYLLFKPFFSVQTLSYVCILCAAPFAALGFFSYHGMRAEQVLLVFLRTTFLIPRRLKCETRCLYQELLLTVKHQKRRSIFVFQKTSAKKRK